MITKSINRLVISDLDIIDFITIKILINNDKISDNFDISEAWLACLQLARANNEANKIIKKIGCN